MTRSSAVSSSDKILKDVSDIESSDNIPITSKLSTLKASEVVIEEGVYPAEARYVTPLNTTSDVWSVNPNIEPFCFVYGCTISDRTSFN